MTTKTKHIREISNILAQIADVMESGDPAQIPALCVRIEALERDPSEPGAAWLAEAIQTFGFERALEIARLATSTFDVLTFECEGQTFGAIHPREADFGEVVEAVAELRDHGFGVSPAKLLAASWGLTPSQARRELKAMKAELDEAELDEAVRS